MSNRPIESAVRELRFQIDRVPDLRRATEEFFACCLAPEAFPDFSLEGRSVDVEGTIGRQGTEVTVFSRISYSLDLGCVRCLELFPVSGTIAEYSLFLHRKQGGPTYPEHEQYGDDGQVNLIPWIRELILTDLPEYPLCREDCPGLCGKCGGNLSHGDCRCTN
ncbi:MAG: YceD family protein [Leptospirales bacterium]